MAGDWIKVEKTTLDKPEVWELAEKLGMSDPDYVLGKLMRFWMWVDGITEDGQIKTSYAFIDRLVHCSGFARALAMIGWLEGRDGLLSIPNYDRHNSRPAKARALEAEAKSLRRKENKNVGQMSDTCPTKTAENVRPEKRREENIGINKVESHSTVVNGNESSTKGSLQSSQFPKSVDEVKAILQAEVDRCLLLLMPDDLHDCAYQYFNAMEGCGWLDSRGRMVTKGQSHAKTYAAK